MLKSEVIEKLKSFGLPVDELVTAIKAPGEVEVQIPDLTVFTADALAARDVNMKSEGAKEKGAEMKNAGIEIASKAIAKAFNLDATTVDFKNPEKVAEALKAMQAKGDPGLSEQIALLQKDVERLNGEKETILKQQKEFQFDNELMSAFPQNRSQVLNDREYLMAIKNNLQFVEEDGQQVVKRNGEIVRDATTRNPKPAKDVIADLFNERKWIDSGGSGGRGGGDKTPTGGQFKTYSEVEKAWFQSHPEGSEMTAEFSAFYQSAAKAPDFDPHK